MISLLHAKPIRIKRASGAFEYIAFAQLSEPDIIGFAAHRADFNGALMQLVIGLLQMTTPARTHKDWEALFHSPPSAADLEKWFERAGTAFEFDGDGARFMQDFGLDSGAESGIDALLIDAAGGSAVDKNTDHFVKRGTTSGMCPYCAVTALFTLQTNAPAGGAGHRTSLRGGGPLTTVVLCSPPRSLWHDLWLNVFPQDVFLERGGDAGKTAPHFTFPWLAPTEAIQAPNAETQPAQVHPWHVYWAMPRRIRLDFDDVRAGVCDLCKRESTQLLQKYVTKPQGLNYKGPWRHPLSPYYKTKEGWLPVHPQPGGFSYRHWLSWALGVESSKKEVQAAANVALALDRRSRLAGSGRLWVFGYDMDNMKVRCWYETVFPLYGLANCDAKRQKEFQKLAAAIISAAEQSVFFLRQAVKQAWFGAGEARGDLSFVDKMFWDGTDATFHRQIKALVDQTVTEDGVGRIDEGFFQQHAVEWHRALSKNALRLFDEDIVGAGAIADQNPQRVSNARRDLKHNLDGKAMRTLLGLPQPDGAKSARKTVSATNLQTVKEA